LTIYYFLKKAFECVLCDYFLKAHSIPSERRSTLCPA